MLFKRPKRGIVGGNMSRIPWIDDLKGFCIVLIVLGHVLAAVQILSQGPVVSMLETGFHYIYSFHVPLFFVLAGLTFSTKLGFAEFAKRKFLRLMVPYFVWGMFSAALFVIIGRFVTANLGSDAYAQKTISDAWWVPFLSILHGGGWPNGKGFSVNGVLWFLPVLFLCEIVYYPIAKRVSGTLSMVAICSVIGILLSPVYWPVVTTRLPYGITWGIAYLPYVMIGDWIGRVFVKGDWRDEKRLSFLWLIFVGGLVLGAALCPIVSEVVRYPKLVLMAFASIIPLLVVARFRVFKWFAILAPHTIAIMIFHKFLIIPMQMIVAKTHLMTCNEPLVAGICVFVFTFISITVCYLVSIALTARLPWTVGRR